MSVTVTSPNMNILVPVPGQQIGPDWATNLYNGLYFTIDSHDHSPGNGAQITAASININTAFSLNNNNLTNANTIQLTEQSASSNIPAATYPATLFVAPNGGSGVYDLWYNDGAGNQIAITQSGSVTGAAGTITGLPSGTASAAFATSTFTFESSTGVGANLKCRSVFLSNSSSDTNTYGVVAPSIATNYTLTLPAIPASTATGGNFIRIDTSGNLSSTAGYDDSTIGITSNNLYVKNGGITRTQLAAVGQQTSSSCGDISASGTVYGAMTNLNVTFTPTGRPVILMVYGIDGDAALRVDVDGNIRIVRTQSMTDTVVAGTLLQQAGGTGGGVASFTAMDTGYTANTSLTYTVQWKVITSGSIRAKNLVLTAYEL